MTWAWSSEQQSLADAVRSLLDRTIDASYPSLTGADSAVGGALWNRLAHEIGVQAVGIPSDFGGSGSTFTDQAVIFAETGRALAPRGLFSTMALAVPALILSGNREVCAEWLPLLADGSVAGTLALTDEAGGEAKATAAAFVDGDWRLHGTKIHVPDGEAARLLVVSATTADGVALFAVDTTGDGLSFQARSSLDMTRPLASVHLDGVTAVRLCEPGGGDALVGAITSRAAVALAYEQVGGAARCLEMTTAYALTRMQFGRAIGSFQAVKHLLADVLVAVECAAAATQFAGSVIELDEDEGLTKAAAVAQVLASEAYTKAANVNVQLHGGIGFTWEHSAHLYLKRAVVSKAFLGSPDDHRETLARLAFNHPSSAPGSNDAS